MASARGADQNHHRCLTYSPNMVLLMDYSASTTIATAPSSTDMPAAPRMAHAMDGVITLYPFLAGLAAHLDRTDLHSLASTCHGVRAALSDYRPALLARSLRCTYPLRLQLQSSNQNTNTDGGTDTSTSTGADTSILGGAWRQLRHPGSSDGRQRCARDLVRACLRCGGPTCRVGPLQIGRAHV